MAEPVRNDEPLSSIRFPQSEPSTRPGPTPLDTLNTKALPEQAEPHVPLGEWPEGSVRGDSDLQDAGAATMDDLRENLENAYYRASKFLRGRMRILRARADLLKERIQSGELQETARARAEEIRDTTTRQVRFARARAEAYGRNYPLQVIAGAAAAAFLLGFIIRMGRDE